MEKLTTISQFFQEKSFFKECLHIGIGMLFILIMDIIFHPDITLIPNYSIGTTTLITLFLIVLAYFLSRISYEIGSFTNTVILFLFFRENKIEELKKKVEKVKEVFNSKVFRVSEEEMATRSMREAIQHFKSSSYLREGFDEADIKTMISYALLGFSILITFVAIFIPHIFNIGLFLIFVTILAVYSCFKTYNLTVTARKLVAMYERIQKDKSSLKNS